MKFRLGSYVAFLPCRIQFNDFKNSTEIRRLNRLPDVRLALSHYAAEMRHRLKRRISAVSNLTHTYGCWACVDLGWRHGERAVKKKALFPRIRKIWSRVPPVKKRLGRKGQWQDSHGTKWAQKQIINLVLCFCWKQCSIYCCIVSLLLCLPSIIFRKIKSLRWVSWSAILDSYVTFVTFFRWPTYKDVFSIN